ncbi:MAG: circularly permuted type 2 ATP-grasp protein, partial [Verrucomicrobia bacterium]|nr:circularly permuted type 2 ATP-grasp protein [Verrucomicrobiota bacterium]
DPLELRGESFLGVAGLVEATRAGNVTVANALGAGLMESPALMAFLPALCRHLLDEDLLMPSVATWWCGQSDELRYVLEHLDTLIIKPAVGVSSRQPWFGGRLSREDRDDLVALIRARPRDFVGQERVALSQAPVWRENRFEARSVVLRSYVAFGGDSFSVLPGGLTRASRDTEDPVVSMQSGGGSKDTWVLADAPEEKPEPQRDWIDSASSDRLLLGVPSRAADNLFWLGRYTERLEQTLRTLRCVLGRLSDEGAREGTGELVALSELLDRLDWASASAAKEYDDMRLQHRVLKLVYRSDIPGSVRELLGRVRFIASTVRDRFSGDTWRILGRLDADARTRPGRLPLASALAMIHNLILDLSAFNGMEMENMTRGHGWRFLDAGRRLERALSILSLLRACGQVGSRRADVLEPVLEIADSLMTYRLRHFAAPRLPGVMELLLSDGSNPRSLAFQLNTLLTHAREFPQDARLPGATAAVARILELQQALERVNVPAAAGRCADGECEALEASLQEISRELFGLGDEVNNYYFSHTVPQVS